MPKQPGFSEAPPPEPSANTPAGRRYRANHKKSKKKSPKARALVQTEGVHKWNPVYIELARRLCAYMGATEEDLANVIGLHGTKSIHRWEEEHPEFREVVRVGRLNADAVVAERTYKRAIGWEHEAVKIYLVDEVTVVKGPDGTETTTTVKKPLYVPYTERYPPDTMAAMYWLNNRQKHNWGRRLQNEKDEPPPSGDTFIQNNLNLEALDAQERADLRELLTRARGIAGPRGGNPSPAR